MPCFFHVLLPSSGNAVISTLQAFKMLSVQYFSSGLKLCVFWVVQIRGFQNFYMSKVMLFFLGYVVSVHMVKVLRSFN